MKPTVFIGSSVEALDIAKAIQANLQHTANSTVWDQDIFVPAAYTLESLETEIKNSDFAIFVFRPDDVLKIRNIRKSAVRDNVLFELGLFTGFLGRDRCFI